MLIKITRKKIWQDKKHNHCRTATSESLSYIMVTLEGEKEKEGKMQLKRGWSSTQVETKGGKVDEGRRKRLAWKVAG